MGRASRAKKIRKQENETPAWKDLVVQAGVATAAGKAHLEDKGDQ